MPISSNVSFSRGNADYVILKPGSYLCTLKSADEGIMKDYEDKTIEFPCISFRYETQTESGTATIFRDVRLSVRETSNLYKDLSGMSPEGLKEAIDEDQKIISLINSLVNKTFIVAVGKKKRGEGHRFLSVSKPPEGVTAPTSTPPETNEVPPSNFEDDDIPF